MGLNVKSSYDPKLKFETKMPKERKTDTADETFLPLTLPQEAAEQVKRNAKAVRARLDAGLPMPAFGTEPSCFLAALRGRAGT